MSSQGRYEIKFAVQPYYLSVIELATSLNSVGFREAYPPRDVNNFYFDTFSLDSYYENLAGISHREKARFRWYGERRFPRAGTLEFKTKRGMMGFKDSFPVEGIPESAADDWRAFRDHLAETLPSDAVIRFRRTSWPTMFNSYRRRYFAEPGGSIRLTIDTKIRCWNQLRVSRPNLDREAPQPDVVVVEIKAPGDKREEMIDVIQRVPLRVGRFSKYVVGMQNFMSA